MNDKVRIIKDTIPFFLVKIFPLGFLHLLQVMEFTSPREGLSLGGIPVFGHSFEGEVSIDCDRERKW